MSDPTNTESPADEAEERMLREGLQATSLSPAAMQRIRRAVHEEWRQTVAPGRRRQWRPLLAAAAAAILAIGMGWIVVGPTWFAPPGAVIGRVALADAPGLAQVKAFRRSSALVSGSEIRAGQKIVVSGDSLVTLDGGGNLRLAKGTRVEVIGTDAIRLRAGELYADIPPGTRSNDALRILTDAGEFRHVGTQFGVAASGRNTRLRVREGQVLWQGGMAGSPVTISAGTEMTVDASGQVSRRQIATAGRDWAWMESISPEIDMEGRPLIEYLEWYARETGRRLEIDDETRAIAAGISMHGNLRGMTLAEALSAVMSTTSLVYELHSGAIRVSSARDSARPRG